MNTDNLPASVVKEIEQVTKVASYLWQREWIERNGGNISINLTQFFEEDYIPELVNFTEQKLPKEVGGLFLFVTGAGCYIRSLIDDIENASCIVYINKEATGYSIIWGGKQDCFRPTSEMASHFKSKTILPFSTLKFSKILVEFSKIIFKGP